MIMAQKFLPTYEFAKEAGLLDLYTEEEIAQMVRTTVEEEPEEVPSLPKPTYKPDNRMVTGISETRESISPEAIESSERFRDERLEETQSSRESAMESSMIQPGGRLLPEVVSREEYEEGVKESQTKHPLLTSFVAGALPLTKEEDYQYAKDAAPNIFAQEEREMTIGGGRIPKTEVKVPETEGTNLADLSAGAGEVFQEAATILLFNSMIPNLGVKTGGKLLESISSKFKVPASLTSNATKKALSNFTRELTADLGASAFRSVESLTMGNSFSQVKEQIPTQLLIDFAMNLGMSAFGFTKAMNYSDDFSTIAQRRMTKEMLSDDLVTRNILQQRDKVYNKMGAMFSEVDDAALKSKINASKKYIENQNFKFKRWYKENLMDISPTETKQSWKPKVDAELMSMNNDDFLTAIDMYKAETGIDIPDVHAKNLDLRETLEQTMKDTPLAERKPLDIQAMTTDPMSSKYKQNNPLSSPELGEVPKPNDVLAKSNLPDSPTEQIASTIDEDFFNTPYTKDIVQEGMIIRQVPIKRLDDDLFNKIDVKSRTNVLEEPTIGLAAQKALIDSTEALKNFERSKITVLNFAEKFETTLHKLANFNPENPFYKMAEKLRTVEYDALGKRLYAYDGILQKHGLDIKEASVKSLNARKAKKGIKNYILNSGETIEFSDSELLNFYAQFNNKSIKGSFNGKVNVINKYSVEQTRVRMDAEDIEKLFSNISEESLEHYKAFREVAPVAHSDISQVNKLITGKDTGFQENYFPVTRKGSSNPLELWQKGDFDLSDSGYLKPRLDDGQTIIVGDFYETVNNYLNFSSTYSQVAPFLNDLNRLFDNESIKTFAGRMMGKKGDTSVIENYIKALSDDMQKISMGGVPEDRITYKMMSNVAKASLGYNPGVWLKQTASYFNAVAYIDPKYLTKGLSLERNMMNANKTFAKYAEILPELKIRELGRVTVETSDVLASSAKKMTSPMRPITKFDNYTIGALYHGIESQVKDQFPDLAMDSAEFITKVRETGLKVLKTQPEYIASARSAMLRTKSPVAKGLTMFQTVPNAMFNMVDEGIGLYKATGDSSLLLNSLAGTTMNVALVSGIDMTRKNAVSLLKKEYSTEDEQRVSDSDTEEYFKIMASNYASVYPLMNQVVSMSKGYDVQLVSIGKLNQVRNRLSSSVSKFEKIMEGDLTDEERKQANVDLAYSSVATFIESAELVTGAPIKNLMKLGVLGGSAVSQLPGAETVDVKVKYNLDKVMGKNYNVSEMYDIVMELVADGKEESAKYILGEMFENGVDIFSPQATKALQQRNVPSLRVPIK